MRRKGHKRTMEEEEGEEDNLQQQNDDEEMIIDEGHVYLRYGKTRLSQKCVKLESCGEGGFGAVDAYFDHALGRVIAVKRLAKYAVYLQEKRRLIKLKKQQFEFVNDLIGFCDEERALLFELGEATLLEVDDIFQDEGNIWRQLDLAYIGWSLLKGLQYLRNIHSFHGDISPNNAMFFMDKVKYIDLGSSEIGNNSQYLRQFKTEFVNHEIKKAKSSKGYTDDQITQNEMFALGKTLLYLALNEEKDKKKFIMGVGKLSQKALISRQKEHFKDLQDHEGLEILYPGIKNIILGLMYPFQVQIGKNIDENVEKVNKPNDEDGLVEKEPEDQENDNKQQQNKAKQEDLDNVEEKQEELIESNKKCSNQNRDNNKDDQEIETNNNCKNYQGEESEDVEKQEKELNKVIRDDNENQRKKDISEEASRLNLEPPILKKLKIEENKDEKTMMCPTIFDTVQLDTKSIEKNDPIFNQKDENEEEQDDNEEEDNIYLNQGNYGNHLNKRQILQQTMEAALEGFAAVLKESFQREEDFGKVLEESVDIRLAVDQIQKNRMEELLQGHQDPQRELVFLSTATAADWRKNIAQSMIQDALNAASLPSAEIQISKPHIQRMMHEKILKIQKRILLKRKQIEDSFIDAVQELQSLCKNAKEYHSLIETHFALHLIHLFLGTPKQAEEQLNDAVRKMTVQNQAAKYAGTLTQRKIEQAQLGEDACIELIAEDVDQQLQELRDNSYSIVY